MLASSDINSITFKRISGSFPNKSNTLHADRKTGNFRIIPYAQKFHSKAGADHIVYLQFNSDVSTDIVLTSFCGNVQIETVTHSPAITIPGTYAKSYFNFAITLDSAYYNKEVYFIAVQGANSLISEPIFVTDLTDKIASGLIKYVKYTNFDRIDSDLDNRFINWSVIANEGHYMDFFIEAIDLTPNDTDSSEVLQGSQSQYILSASYFAGKVLETSGIPDYMAVKLGMASSLDVFTVNDIQYIKNGEITQARFGNSTSYQVSMKLTEKNAIGINVDNLTLAGDTIVPEPAPVEAPTIIYPMYIGSVADANPTEVIVKAMAQRTGYKSNQSIHYTIDSRRYCFAYPTAYGVLSYISSVNDDEITSGFAVTTLDFTFSGVTVNYTIYTLIRPTTQTAMGVSYLF